MITISTRKSRKREQISWMVEFFWKKLGLDLFDGDLCILTTDKIQLDGLAGTTYIPERKTAVLAVSSKIRSPEILCLVLAHEMVHAKQFLEGRLREVDGKHFWLGEDAGHYSYYEQPWEIEAYEQMFSLVDDFWEDLSKSMV